MKIDISTLDNPPLYLTVEDWCCFLREYTSGAGYSASDGNQDIANFKKKSSTRGSNQWRWKERAVEKFAIELAQLFQDREYSICTMPSSKSREDPEYDPRFDMLLERLCALCPNLRAINPIKKLYSTSPLHEGGARNISEVYASLEWIGFAENTPDGVFLIDDMITCGTTFKACKKMILEHVPTITVWGAFWTRCIWKDDAIPGFTPIS